MRCRSYDTGSSCRSRLRCPDVAVLLQPWLAITASFDFLRRVTRIWWKKKLTKFYPCLVLRWGRVALSTRWGWDETRTADHEWPWPRCTLYRDLNPWSLMAEASIPSFQLALFTVFRYIPTGFVIRIFWLYTDYTTNAGAITMFLDWTKLWEEDVERVWGSFETGKWLWWVCRRRRAEIAGALERLVLAKCRGDDSSVRAESSVDGARWSVDHSNTTVVSANSSADSGTTTHNSDGTWKYQIAW